jgi:hypothetical protein
MDRSPRDGQPYYCTRCKLGFAEYMACERTDCALESNESAEMRSVLVKAASKLTVAQRSTLEIMRRTGRSFRVRINGGATRRMLVRLRERGLVQGPPWRITKAGRQALKERT